MRQKHLLLALLSVMGCSDPAPAPPDGSSSDAANPATGPRYLLLWQGDRIVARSGETGAEVFSDPSLHVVLQRALDGLAPGRTWQETVALRGRFVLTATVLLPSYVRLDLSEAEIILADTTNLAMFKNGDPTTGNRFITVVGGTLDGNGEKNTMPAPYMKADDDSHAIVYFNRVSDAEVTGTRFFNAQTHAVYLYQCRDVRIREIRDDLSGYEGVMTWQGSNVSVVGSTFFHLKSSAIATATCPGTRIEGNTIAEVRRDHSSISLNSVRSHVLANRIENTDGPGITVGHLAPEFSASDSILSENVILNVAGPGLQMLNGNASRNVIAHHNRIEAASEGIALAGGTASLGGVQDYVLESNTISRCRLRGIRINTGPGLALKRVQVRNNVIYANGQAGSTSADVSSGIVLLGDGIADYEGVTVTGNRVFDDQPQPTQPYGIVVKRTTRTVLKNNDLRGNGVGDILSTPDNVELIVSDNL